MTAIRTYAQELAAVEAVLRGRRVEAREWARPDAWVSIALCLVDGDGYYVRASAVISETYPYEFAAAVGGSSPSLCNACVRENYSWPDNPCKHQSGLAALWVGGHPIRHAIAPFDHELHQELEGTR